MDGVDLVRFLLRAAAQLWLEEQTEIPSGMEYSTAQNVFLHEAERAYFDAIERRP